MSGGLSFNTNDSMLATGNSNGDITIRNMIHSNGNPPNKHLNIVPTDDVGSPDIKLQYFERNPSMKCEVT